MKRIIKFRGFNNSNSEWNYGNLVIIDDEYHITEQEEYEEASDYTLVDKKSVGQFTGLYDVNNKEIYEGDIVCSDELYFENYLVKFHQGNFIVEPFNTVRPLRDPLDESYSIGVFSPDFKLAKTKLKIIGNIYEDK